MARQADPERIARKKEQIAETAARLFSAQGYDRTSVAQVAKAVGTSAASIFYYFEDKASLFRAVFERDLPAAEKLIEQHRRTNDPMRSILEVLDALSEDASDPSASGMVVELLRRAGDDPELLEVVMRTADVIRRGLAELIFQGIDEGIIDAALDPVETAEWLQAVVDATYLNAQPGYSPREKLHRTAVRYLAPPENPSANTQEKPRV